MTKVYAIFDVDEETPVQWVGVHPLRWRSEWGEPTAMFREAEIADIASVPDVKVLVDAAQTYLRLADDPPFYNIGVVEWYAASAAARNELESALAAFHPPSEKDEPE